MARWLFEAPGWTAPPANTARSAPGPGAPTGRGSDLRHCFRRGTGTGTLPRWRERRLPGEQVMQVKKTKMVGFPFDVWS